MHTLLRRTTCLGAALLTAGLLGACASRAPLPELEQARSTVERTTAVIAQFIADWCGVEPISP